MWCQKLCAVWTCETRRETRAASAWTASSQGQMESPVGANHTTSTCSVALPLIAGSKDHVRLLRGRVFHFDLNVKQFFLMAQLQLKNCKNRDAQQWITSALIKVQSRKESRTRFRSVWAWRSVASASWALLVRHPAGLRRLSSSFKSVPSPLCRNRKNLVGQSYGLQEKDSFTLDYIGHQIAMMAGKPLAKLHWWEQSMTLYQTIIVLCFAVWLLFGSGPLIILRSVFKLGPWDLFQLRPFWFQWCQISNRLYIQSPPPPPQCPVPTNQQCQHRLVGAEARTINHISPPCCSCFSFSLLTATLQTQSSS